MATEESSSQSSTVSLDSYDTALCMIPPKHLWPMFNGLRSLYDRAYEKWPPHVNLVYPYVRVALLSSASALIASRMSSVSKTSSLLDRINISLNAADCFPHRRNNTIFLYDNDKKRTESLEELRKITFNALGHNSVTKHRLHLTIGQSKDLNASSHRFLLEKCSLLPAAEWTVDTLYILVRERMNIDENAFSQMKIWGTILNQDPSMNMPKESNPTSLTIASYNVLAEFEYPPSKTRFSFIVQTVLQQAILADVLVLQEVTNEFLSFYCQDDGIRTHLNTVVFSRWPFSLHWLSFRGRHKGSIIVEFKDIGKRDGEFFILTILSTVHLACAHLSEKYPSNPWILAGDFNITTSAYTLELAVEKKAISSRGLFEGEEGATFDPTINDLAAEFVGNGFNNRPQRYDRILVKGEDLFVVTDFAMFGRKPGYLHENIAKGASDFGPSSKSNLSYTSDHWGVKCSLKINQRGDIPYKVTSGFSVPVYLLPASGSLSNISELKKCLGRLDVLPSAADIMRRKLTLQLLIDVALENDNLTNRSKPAFILVPVGSYGLGVWTTSSDIDCLCIGPIRFRTFFTLAIQRIRKTDSKDIKLRRKVNVHSGIMLELEVLNIKMDLKIEAYMSLAGFSFAKVWVGKAKTGSVGDSLIACRQVSVMAADGQYCRTFFNHYADFDWNAQLAFDPFFHKQLRYVRTARELITILGFHPPSLNTALNASPASGTTWTTFLTTTLGCVEFLSAFRTYIKIDAHFWGVSLAKGSSFIGWLESRCVMLLVDERDYEGCYLIGLEQAGGSNEEPISRDDLKTTLSSLRAVLQKFEGQIRSDAKYFDPNTSWMSATLINRSELGPLQLDSREWGEYTAGDDDFDDEELEDYLISDSDNEVHCSSEVLPGIGAKSKGKVATTSRHRRPVYSGKFRSSIDMMNNRIRWDPNMDSSDYIVGYEDRFLGTKERALDDRILYLKRKSDETIVWDRKERWDIVFGSDISSIDTKGSR
ncbi:2'-5' RNA ligase superfamily-domain-containing protein [Xylaria nigripes]|nr:2'-5' RNA ligase superfamily-domain-containing protein [Xylaria nigripes]